MLTDDELLRLIDQRDLVIRMLWVKLRVKMRQAKEPTCAF